MDLELSIGVTTYFFLGYTSIVCHEGENLGSEFVHEGVDVAWYFHVDIFQYFEEVDYLKEIMALGMED